MGNAIDPIGSRPMPPNTGASRPGVRANVAGAGAVNAGAAPDAPPASAGEAARLQWAAEQLESLFINELWKSMRRTVPKTGMFDGAGVRLFEEMLDEERSRAMASAGGLGLAALLYEQLSVHIRDERPARAEDDSTQADGQGRTSLPGMEHTEK